MSKDGCSGVVLGPFSLKGPETCGTCKSESLCQCGQLNSAVGEPQSVLRLLVQSGPEEEAIPSASIQTPYSLLITRY